MTAPRPRRPDESRLLEKAARFLPGGVLGTSRFAPGLDFVVESARGSRLSDVSGREYIDYLLGSGPMILGHSHPAVVTAVTERLVKGSTYFLVNEPAILLAEELARAVPCCDKVRFTSSGSEATFFTLRLARAYRKRDRILKFEGGYHGSHDYALMSQTPKSPKAFPAPTPDSAGIPGVLEGEVLIAPYNDLATTEAIVSAHAETLAGVIVEPFQRVIPPTEGFLQGLRAVTQRHQIPLIFDEVVTGFRFAYGGAQEYYGVVPDLAAYGKIIAGGFPLGAVCGRDALMGSLDPAREGTPEFVSQVGTLNGNPIAAAAGLATLAELRRPGSYPRLREIGGRLKAGLAEIVSRAGVPAQVVGEASVFDLVFTDRPVTDYRGALSGDPTLLRAFNEECLRRGVLKGSQKFYVSLAHTDADVDRTLEAFEGAMATVAQTAALRHPERRGAG